MRIHCKQWNYLLLGGGYSENADDAITAAKVADGALLTAHYAAGSVDAAALGEHQSFLGG